MYNLSPPQDSVPDVTTYAIHDVHPWSVCYVLNSLHQLVLKHYE